MNDKRIEILISDYVIRSTVAKPATPKLKTSRDKNFGRDQK